MKKYISVLCLVSAIALPTFTSYAHDLPHTPATQKTQAPRAKGVWIDVRSADEFKQGHLSHNKLHKLNPTKMHLSIFIAAAVAVQKLHCKNSKN